MFPEDPMESILPDEPSSDVQSDDSLLSSDDDDEPLIGTERVAGSALHLRRRTTPKIFARSGKPILRKGDDESSAEEQRRVAERSAEAAKKHESVRKKFINVRKKLTSLASPVLARKKPSSAKEVSRILIAILKEFDEATADVNDILDLHSLRSFLSDLIGSDWVVDACNGPQSHRIETMLKNSVETLLQKEIALSPSNFTAGIHLLQSLSRVHKAGAEAAHKRIYDAIDDVFEKISIKSIRARGLNEKEIVASLLEDGISPEEQAARAEQYLRMFSTEQETSVLTNVLRNKKVGHLFDSARDESLISQRTSDGKRRYDALLEKVQGSR